MPHSPTATRLVDRVALSPAEAAELLGVTRQMVYKLIDAGTLPRYKVGRCTKLRTDDVLALVGGRPDVAA